MVLIVFEGGEGVGKTTQVELLYDALLRAKQSVLKTREPGGTPLAEKIRNLFKEKNNDPPKSLTELYLISAARNQHVEQILLPALAKKKFILCDRFIDSTYVYQSIVGGLKKEIVDKASLPVLHDVVPDLTFIFYCDPKLAHQRMQAQTHRTLDRLDSFTNSIHEKISLGYKEIYDNKYTYPNGVLPERVFVDASASVTDIFLFLTQEIKKKFGLSL